MSPPPGIISSGNIPKTALNSLFGSAISPHIHGDNSTGAKRTKPVLESFQKEAGGAVFSPHIMIHGDNSTEAIAERIVCDDANRW